VCQPGALPGSFERSAWLESLKSRSNRAPVVAGPFRRTAPPVPTRSMIVSPTPSSALESWRRTRRPNSSSRAKMVGSGRRILTGTIRAGEVDAARRRKRCQRRKQRFTIKQTLGLPRTQSGAAPVRVDFGHSHPVQAATEGAPEAHEIAAALWRPFRRQPPPATTHRRSAE